MALPAADQEPDRVGQHRGHEGHGQEGGEVHSPAAREGSGHDQRREGGDGRPDLLQEDVGEDDGEAVLDEVRDDLVHGYLGGPITTKTNIDGSPIVA
jgi:hypothetical protein